MNNINAILAENIQKYRKKSGLTQIELAEKLGVTSQAVSKWENAKSMPDVILLPAIADFFECSIDDLFSYVPMINRAKINYLPNSSVPEAMKEYAVNQIRCQLDHEGSTNKLLEIIADNIDGKLDLTDENIERMLDAYRDLYKGIQKKNKNTIGE